ncbi:hypothetical protein [Pararhodonellum marinum]|uniref:hypothetical protein n=1 Tax=Pararhodonellum marinum TaxID=2755358 RepID=UPI00188F68C2|nr:hypothetical protein [Pararhodonellum marinum]
MKNCILFGLSILLFVGCNTKTENRYIVTEEGRVMDIVTGDEYSMDKFDTLTVVHVDGTTEEISVEASPIADDTAVMEFIRKREAELADRKERMMLEQKNNIIAARKERYKEYSDEELIAHFNKIHKESAPSEQQMDVILELIERDAINQDDATGMMEVDVLDIDFSRDYVPTERD